MSLIDYTQQLFADRIGGSSFGLEGEMFKFEKIKRAKRLAIKENPYIELIDLGVGEPDAMAEASVVEILSQEAGKPENRFYSDNGIHEFKAAAARYMENVFGVNDLDPEVEINHVIGSKSALAMLPAAFINPGDITLMPIPSYPVLATFTKYYGGDVVQLPLLEKNGFLPQLNQIDSRTLEKAKLLYLNYPSNPTGAVASREFFAEVVEFAKQNNIIVVHDAAYAALVFDGVKPLSFLSVPGAKEVGVELHSLSKSFNMTGWRIGFIAGHPNLIKAFATIKDNSDSGQFIPIQKAAAYTLAHPEITVKSAEKYSHRHGLLVEALRDSGFRAVKPKGSFFLYVEIPAGVQGGPTFANAEEFGQYLIRKHLISSVPWDDVGNYIRFSVTFQADRDGEKKVIDEIRARLSRDQFIFGGRM